MHNFQTHRPNMHTGLEVKTLRNFPKKPRKPQVPEPVRSSSPEFRAARPALTSMWGRSWPAMVRSRSCSPIPFRFLFLFVSICYFSFLSFVDYQIGRIRVTATTTSFSAFPFHLSSFRFGRVRWRSDGDVGWLESPSASLSPIGMDLSFQWKPRPSTALDVGWTPDLEYFSSSSLSHP